MLLVLHEGSNAEYLSELHHREGAAVALHIPIDRPNVPAALAAEGKESVLEGVGHRGSPVLAATRKISGSQWLMGAKEGGPGGNIRPAPSAGRTSVLKAGLLLLVAMLGVGSA